MEYKRILCRERSWFCILLNKARYASVRLKINYFKSATEKNKLRRFIKKLYCNSSLVQYDDRIFQNEKSSENRSNDAYTAELNC